MKIAMLLSLSLLFLAACQIEKKDNSTTTAATETTAIPVKIVRFDQELRQLDTADLQKLDRGVAALTAKYPGFATDYFGAYMQLISPRRTAKENSLNLKGFLKHPPVRQMLDTIGIVFSDMTDIEQQMGLVFARYEKLFAGKKAPKLFSIYSEYTNAVISFPDSILCFSPEFFLGAYDRHYPQDLIPQYVARALNRTHLPTYLCEQLLENQFTAPEGARLIDIMIHNGKILYAMHQLMPAAPDSVLLRITTDQANWCRTNEVQLWSHLTSENLLYETDAQKTKKLVSPAPYVPGIPPAAPGGVANYLGWQIVEAYMTQNPNVSLTQLLMPADGQKILEASKFKPAKR